MKKGLLDAYVLMLLSHGDTYGYKLIQDVSDVIDVSESTLYPVLRRLEGQECLSTYNMEHGGRLRKYYRIMKGGLTKLADYRADCIELRHIIDRILERPAS
ncbi:MAG: PadR family transcriptional regulator [Firmicutes bacterium]|nr:PadR family transcriptional regulator [Bacillota bacterium]